MKKEQTKLKTSIPKEITKYEVGEKKTKKGSTKAINKSIIYQIMNLIVIPNLFKLTLFQIILVFCFMFYLYYFFYIQIIFMMIK